MRVCLLSYAFPPLRYPRAIQVAHLVRHSGLEGLEVLAADQEEGGDEGLAGTLPSGVPVTRLPWRGRARLARTLRARTIKDRALVPDQWRPWARVAA